MNKKVEICQFNEHCKMCLRTEPGVELNLKEDEDLLSELERLSKSFGIGIIQLNLDDIHSSEILFQSKTREYLDWDTMNKLCEENEDFKKFIQDVKIDFESKRIHKSEYDLIPDDIENHISKIIKKRKGNILSSQNHRPK